MKKPSAENFKLGELIAKHRKSQGRSARDVARQAGIDISTMVKLEQGYYASPNPATLKGVSKALGIPLLELFHAAGYVTPYDLVDMLTSPSVERAHADREALEARDRYLEARSRYVGELIDKYGLDYTGPEFAATLIDH